MTRLSWLTSRTLTHDDITLPCADGLQVEISPRAGRGQLGGIRPASAGQLRFKSIAWPFIYLHNQTLVTGFLERALGRGMHRHLKTDSVFLEIGAGDMSLRRFLPRATCYNGLDIAYSEFALRRVLLGNSSVNLVLATVTAIPLPHHCVDVVASKEVLMYVPNVPRALAEIRRVLRLHGRFLCTIGNLHSRKYAAKGLQSDFASAFRFDEFKSLAESQGFRCEEAFQKGWWIPLPAWLSHTTHQLPITSADEYHNTNFVYCLEAI